MHRPAVDDRLSDPSRAPRAGRLRYQPFYCEENIWWLCAEPPRGVLIKQVIFVASRYGICPFAEQRLAGADGLVWWDYHCIGLDHRQRIWDLDSLLPLPVAAAIWLDRSFAHAAQLPRPLQPRFRLVPADFFREDFRSNRAHMRSPDGGWLQPPPPWPCIGSGVAHRGLGDGGSNLSTYRDLSQSEGPGRVLELAEFRAASD